MSKCALTNIKCPRTCDREAEVYCPWWSEQIWENATTGESKLRKQCGIGLLFESITVGNSTAHAAMRESSKVRNIIETAMIGASNTKQIGVA